jgi:hypothetical protein
MTPLNDFDTICKTTQISVSSVPQVDLTYAIFSYIGLKKKGTCHAHTTTALDLTNFLTMFPLS